MATTIVESCQVAPSSGAPKELLLPLLYSDIALLNYPCLQNLFFYSFKCSESHFLDTIVGNLKNSLSLALKHFPPIAGKIIFPVNSNNGSMPVSQYVVGDSISMTVAVSKADLIPLTGNLSKDADQFLDFIPQIPAHATNNNDSSESIKYSVAAVRVTLFPNQGICIGLTIHHSIADGSSLVHFLKTWASINTFQRDDHVPPPPFYDRSGVQDADRLTRAFWERMKVNKPAAPDPTDSMVLATFVLSGAHIGLLKKFVLSKKPSVTRLSSLTAACAHLWTSFARSASAHGSNNNNDDDDEPEYFLCAVNCRGRLNPPLPDTYFGNCVALVIAQSTSGRLKSEQGIVFAAEAIGEAIQKTLMGISDGSSLSLLVELERIRASAKRLISILGSPKSDMCEIDFGWGRPTKFEFVRFIGAGSLNLCKSTESQGGVDVMLSMPKVKVDAFAVTFNQGLTQLLAQNNISTNHCSKL